MECSVRIAIWLLLLGSGAGAWERLPEGLVFCGDDWLWVRAGFPALVCFLEAVARLESVAVLESVACLESAAVLELSLIHI